MATGQGSLSSQQKKEIVPGPPFTAAAANNGLSVSALPAGKIVLGQNTGAVGNPAILLSNREIPLAGFSVTWLGALITESIDDATGLYQLLHGVNPQFFVDPVNRLYLLGNTAGGNNSKLSINDALQLMSLNTGGGEYLEIDVLNDVFWLGDIPGLTTNTFFYLDSNLAEIDLLGRKVLSCDFTTSHYVLGPMFSGNMTSLDILDVSKIITLKADNGVHITEAAFLLHADNALTDYSGAVVGTLNNAPAVGNPTKWIAIDDAGVTRRIPTW